MTCPCSPRGTVRSGTVCRSCGSTQAVSPPRRCRTIRYRIADSVQRSPTRRLAHRLADKPEQPRGGAQRQHTQPQLPSLTSTTPSTAAPSVICYFMVRHRRPGVPATPPSYAFPESLASRPFQHERICLRSCLASLPSSRDPVRRRSAWCGSPPEVRCQSPHANQCRAMRR